MLEVLFVCDTSGGHLTCSAWDFRTGTNFMNYKGGGNAASQSLCILHTEYIFTANGSKPTLHVWPINAQEQVSTLRFVVPGQVSALALSPDGCYLVAGIQETIYVWQLSTGRMLNAIAKHYQSVSCIRFTDDSSHFVTASRDGSVLVWNLTQVVCGGDDNHSPVQSINDHGLPVTDVFIGAGAMRAYMYTVSMDRTCKVYDLNNFELLLNVVFGEALLCVVVNALETSVFIGTNVGNIYELRIDELPRNKEHHIVKDQTNKFIGHKENSSVNCLALSLDGQTLVSGGSDHQVLVWNISSRQMTRSLLFKGPVSNLALRFTDPVIFQPEYKQRPLQCTNLRRMIDPPEADEEQTIEVLITEPIQLVDKTFPRSVGHLNPSTSQPISGGESLEVEKLRLEVQHLRNVNRRLFQVAAKQVFRGKK